MGNASRPGRKPSAKRFEYIGAYYLCPLGTIANGFDQDGAISSRIHSKLKKSLSRASVKSGQDHSDKRPKSRTNPPLRRQYKGGLTTLATHLRTRSGESRRLIKFATQLTNIKSNWRKRATVNHRLCPSQFGNRRVSTSASRKGVSCE